jgi:hypothetical protein
MRAIGWVALFVAGATWLVPTSMAQAGEKAPPCMTCHKPNDTTIDPELYARSVHHALDCTFCHTEGFDKVPHTSQATDDCVDCHEGPATPPIDFDKIAR